MLQPLSWGTEFYLIKIVRALRQIYIFHRGLNILHFLFQTGARTTTCQSLLFARSSQSSFHRSLGFIASFTDPLQLVILSLCCPLFVSTMFPNVITLGAICSRLFFMRVHTKQLFILNFDIYTFWESYLGYYLGVSNSLKAGIFLRPVETDWFNDGVVNMFFFVI